MARPWESRDHIFIGYQTDEDYRQLLGIHLTAAMERGERIAYIADGARASATLGWLPVTSSEMDSLTQQRQLLVWLAEESLLADGMFDPARCVTLLSAESRAATREGYGGLRVCADMGSALREQPDCERLLEFERQLSTVLAEGRLTGLTLACQYDQQRFPCNHLNRLRQAHSVALSAEQAQQREPVLRMTPLEGQPGLSLAGELDESNLNEFSTTLGSAFRDDRDFHLDLTDLRFADVATVTLFAHTAQSLRNGCRFVLRSPGPVIRTILRIHGWDQMPALSLLEGGESW